MSQKKYYMDAINILVLVAIFAGSLTIATQFFTSCSEPRLASLLALASELFIESLAGLTIAFLLLYGFWDTDIIQDGPKPVRFCGRKWGRHSLVVAQIVIIGFVLIVAFLVLGVAIIVIGNHWARGLAVALVFLVFLGTLLVGVMVGRNKYVRVSGCLPGPADPVPIHDVERDLTEWQGTVLVWFLMLEVIIMTVVLSLGIWQAIHPPEGICDTSSIGLHWLSSTIAVSEANPRTNPPITITNVETVLSIMITDEDTIITRTDDPSTSISTEILTTTITKTPTLNGSASPEASSTLSLCSTCEVHITPLLTFVTSTVTYKIPCTTESLGSRRQGLETGHSYTS